MTTLASLLHPAIEPKTRSDAAQAVYEAAHKAWVTNDDPSLIAGAALRAAAAQMIKTDDLHTIATELEGVND